jgi:uncharacterized membrane protein
MLGLIFHLAAIVSIALHYLGWLGIGAGILALVLGYGDWGIKLILVGMASLVARWFITLLFMGIAVVLITKE